MLNETFYLDGIDARTVGVRLQKPIEFSEAVPICEVQTIPGRNGDLIWETGSYENRSGLAYCFCLREDVNRYLTASGKFFNSKRGYRKLETSDDFRHFWMARVENSPTIYTKNDVLSSFEICFDCKPQRFLKSGFDAVVVESGSVLYNEYGFDALPFITVYGSGNGTLKVGNSEIEIKSIESVIYIDCDTQNAYNDRGNQNMNINALEFPRLLEGDSVITFSGGIEKVEIIPRWWEL